MEAGTSRMYLKITSELQELNELTIIVYPIGTVGIPPLAGTHMLVWGNRWYNEGIVALVLITGRGSFFIKKDVVKFNFLTSPNKKEEMKCIRKYPQI